MKLNFLVPFLLLATYTCLAQSQSKKPNIIVMFSDDVGETNVSLYSKGVMGYRTPNIDRIGEEGVTFTDYYGEQSCTAGRAAFITGQYAVRVGLPKVGLVGSPQGLNSKDVTLAEMLKPLGYATGQFGKNHLGDRNEFLPTVHGFDEFYGHLYHLNTFTEMFDKDYPINDKEFVEKYGPRGVIESYASTKDDTSSDPRFGKVGKQTVKDTGPLTEERIKLLDEEFTDKTLDFIRRNVKDNKPFFCWYNTSRMHFPTILADKWEGKTGQDLYADGMKELDYYVGQILDLVDELGIADNTIIVWTSDNGPMTMNWPDGGMAPYRSEKGTNWEGAFRVPCVMRWPGVIKPGTELNGIVAHHDWFPTLYAAASGDGNIVEELMEGKTIGGVDYKVHLDGYNLIPYLSGKTEKSPRQDFMYFGDDMSLLALRYNDWKFTFAEQRAQPGTWDLWRDPFVELRVPRIENLRRDPFERAQKESTTYAMWIQDKQFMLVPVSVYAGKMAASFEKFPPRGAPANYSLSNVLKALQTPTH
ncbi:arylsulfatase [uncultured Draconibacterium sp.]|uniref:arylsulfatase n=1 Tax=uncultured Draconibacterium sp. TaxID=1573823 RepID=UPI002605317F|nr:arylsulfatase [uncultured Draconibacterium sp.]